MGYTTRNTHNGQITDFWPDDADNSFYIESDASMATIMELAQQKWGNNIELSRLRIEAQHIHTHCLGYDRYDAIDHTNFLKISYP